MTQGTGRRAYVVGTLAAIVGVFVAPHGCGGDETSNGGTTTTTMDCTPPCEGGEQCVDGQCRCPTGTTKCDGACIPTESDPGNCGACGTTCDESEECIDSSCQCPAGMAACSSGCTDLATDKLNCGQCNVPCLAVQSCEASKCVCPPGTEQCFDYCVDTSSDTKFCGDCTTPCDPGEHCITGDCQTVSGCDQVPEDQYEGNDDCSLARPLPDAVEGAPTAVTIADATLHHINGSADTDWFTMKALEANHSCDLLSGQCYFVFDTAFTPPDAAAYASYEMCVSQGNCGAGEICTTQQDWNDTAGRYELSRQWKGTCGLPDDADMYVRITRNGGTESCFQYTLEYQTSYTDEACP